MPEPSISGLLAEVSVENQGLRAERDRLREALEWAAPLVGLSGYHGARWTPEEARVHVRAALSQDAAEETTRERLTERVANVLAWGYTTGPGNPEATFEKFAEQIFKVMEAEGVVLPTAGPDSGG